MKNNTIFEHLKFIYGEELANKYYGKFFEKIATIESIRPKNNGWFDEKDSIMISYGDSIIGVENQNKIETLHHFSKTYLDDAINTIHILPCFPYTADDGFSIVDYKKINPDFGTWNDVESLAKDYNLMLDLVANHISKSSYWFQEFLKGNEKYKDYFTVSDPNLDYSKVFRPRTLPLLTEVETVNGKKNVWTTFSEDQIDLNYQNPEVLLEVIDVLIEYIRHGASLIRLDAIAFIWKEIGTSCIHRDETHEIIKLVRTILEEAKANVKIVTETNVPHKENISYFGNGYNEATMVYNFPLPPLTLYTFQKGDASIIKSWANSLELPSEEVTFFNFLASHDGIGLNPAKGLIEESEINLLADKIKDNRGYISYNDIGGIKSPYEMNMNFLDALKIAGDVDIETEANRFIASQSIILSFRGVPGIYIHSILGSRNYHEGVEKTKANRTINREKLNYNSLVEELENKESLRYKVLNKYKKLLFIRKENKCFSPRAKQEVLMDVDSRIFALKRFIDKEEVITLTNISCENVVVNLDTTDYKSLTSESYDGILAPYQVVWLKK